LLNTGGLNAISLNIYNYANTTFYKNWISSSVLQTSASVHVAENRGGTIRTTSAITELQFTLTGSTFNGGTVLIYGVK
jgi:hypothetical protein